MTQVDEVADARVDFVRRLFPVAVSVGFAGQLNQIVTDSISARQINLAQLGVQHGRDLWLLLVSLAAVVASWEGYLASIKRTSLKDPFRFYIDILIVFAYLGLMLLSHADKAWFWALAAIFVLYGLWDLAGLAYRVWAQTRLPGEPYYKRSIVITLVWLAFVLALARFNHAETSAGFALATFAALIAVILYRVDKFVRAPWLLKVVLLAAPTALLVLSVRS